MSGAIIGRYRVERLLSKQGTMSLIYLARDTEHANVYVVLKCARVAGRHRHLFQDSLRQEVEVLQKLSHPGVIHLYPALEGHFLARADPLPGAPWYCVMEYLQGGSLAEHLPTLVARFSLEERLRLFDQIVGSVAYLHAQGYGHGDLKPDHVLFRVTPTGDQPLHPVLIDFGAAAPLGETPADLTLSLPYAAPELVQALKQKISHPRTAAQDVWALGAILYEIVTGERLLAGARGLRSEHTTMMQHIHLRNIPASMERLLKQLLEATPEKRCSVVELQRELQTLLSPFANRKSG